MEHWHPQASPSVVDADGRDVLAQNVNHPGMLDEIRLNNAALIVSSVNARDLAVEAMEEALRHLDVGIPEGRHLHTIAKLRTALAELREVGR